MSSLGTFAGVTLDTRDPATLAEFYLAFTGWEKVFGNDTIIHIASPDRSARLGFQRVSDHSAPVWPSADKQLHVDFRVDDLDKVEAQLVELGATKPEFQPAPQRWRVLQDPAGHPFCITTMG